MTFLILLFILSALIFFYYLSEHTMSNILDFFSGVYEIAIAFVGLATFFALMFLVIFEVDYKTNINNINTLYNDIYFLEQYLDNPKMVVMVQDKIIAYENEKKEAIAFGKIAGMDVSEFRAYPTLEIGENFNIIES